MAGKKSMGGGGGSGRPIVKPVCARVSDGGAPWAPPRRGPPGERRAADDAPETYQRRLT